MRILQICSARFIGGGERHVADLSNGLTARGHAIFAAVFDGSPVTNELTELPAGNIRTFPLRNALDIASASRIATFVRDNNIELINAHLAKDYTVAAAAARLVNIPFVITRHVLFPMSRIHRVLLKRVRCVIAPSNAVAASLRREGLFPAEKIETIRYGIDIHKFSSDSPIRRDVFRVGAIGNLDPVKGFDVLIRAAAIVVRQLPQVRFEIVGSDRSHDRHNEKELRQLIAGLGLEASVELSGWSGDVRAKLSSFGLFVSASRSESFGFAIAEAMLGGVPVIATETEGAREIIADPSLGVLVPVESPDALAKGILELLESSERRDEISQNGRDHVAEKFSLERTISSTEALYRRVIDGG